MKKDHSEVNAGIPSQQYDEWFQSLTGHASALAWQASLASDRACLSKLIRIPTGLGKTDGVLAAWIYHRLHLCNSAWPRRLVWCLPMRGLVEQTEHAARRLAACLPESSRPAIHVAMGGEDAGDWSLFPERPAVIIGTQDMLLSRAMNRGFASARARWPMEFGLLNQDALWVMDEVQLMDVGLATSAQLQAFRDDDASKSLRPCSTWWMSATLQPDWLHSVDTATHHPSWVANPCSVSAKQRAGGIWEISKSASTEVIGPGDHGMFAKRILTEHDKLSDSFFGKITLVVCNTVDRASRTYDALRAVGRKDGLELVHSRFRPAEREVWRENFLSRDACISGTDRIIVATQVVEAGVDISAGCLITELAPWPSLVQRFGRCSRYSGSGSVIVVDRRKNADDVAPYQSPELESAWETVQHFRDVGIKALEAHESSLSDDVRKRLYPYAPAHLLLRKEFEELFDTTPDLTGADIDISRLIRSGTERDVQIFWRDIEQDRKGNQLHRPSDDTKPHRRELCSIPFLKAREWLCEKDKSKLKPTKRAWVWDWLDGEWKTAVSEALLPGRIICVASDTGGYRADRGFDDASNGAVPPILEPPVSLGTRQFEEADDEQDGEQLSHEAWKTIACHTKEVAEQAHAIARDLNLDARLQDLIDLASLWHDWGKAHPAFQGSIRGGENTPRLDRSDLAKAPDKCWPRKDRYRYLNGGEIRPAFRHELASALGLFTILAAYMPRHEALLGPWTDVFTQLGNALPKEQVAPLSPPTPLIIRLLSCTADEFDLVAYLVAAHHGKVRLGLNAAPKDQEYRDRDGRGLPIRGVREGDLLPSIELVAGEPPIPEIELTLSPAAMGLSSRTGISWRERSISLEGRHGPAALALLEAILRAADIRASRLKTVDPALIREVAS